MSNGLCPHCPTRLREVDSFPGLEPQIGHSTVRRGRGRAALHRLLLPKSQSAERVSPRVTHSRTLTVTCRDSQSFGAWGAQILSSTCFGVMDHTQNRNNRWTKGSSFFFFFQQNTCPFFSAAPVSPTGVVQAVKHVEGLRTLSPRRCVTSLGHLFFFVCVTFQFFLL